MNEEEMRAMQDESGDAQPAKMPETRAASAIIAENRQARYPTIHDWLADARRLPSLDLDNVVLFTGPEGEGKSTLMFQVMRALDPTFNVERIHFTIDDFLDTVPTRESGIASALDEAHFNRRRGMHGSTIRMLDYLQVCRGKRHHLALCFPHEDMLDRGILDYRVRWNFHVPRRGHTLLRSRVRVVQTQRRNMSEQTHAWVIHGSYSFVPNSGRSWDLYLLAKQDAMRAFAESGGPPKKAKPQKPFLERMGWRGGPVFEEALRTVLRMQAAGRGVPKQEPQDPYTPRRIL